jgi:hypothetical protein
MIVVDSSVWIDFFNKVENAETVRLRGFRLLEDVVVGDVVLFEVLRGAKNEDHARRLGRNLGMFETRTMLGVDIAHKAAMNYRKLRSLGITVRKFPDMIIGTYCIENDHWLLHRDRDFLPMVKHLGLKEF